MTTKVISTPKWFADIREQILAHMSSAVEAFANAGAVYKDAVDKDPTFRDWIADELPDISSAMWRKLENVGRGLLDARIAVGCAYGNKLARLPVSEQKKALEQPLPLLTDMGTSDHILVRLDSIQPIQAEQLFAGDHIRSLAEQRAWIESKRAESVTVKKAKPTLSVEIDRKRHRAIIGGVEFTTGDLLDIVRKLSE